LYIDCTGFSAILIEKTLGSKFTSIVDDLINDSAIAIRVPYKDKKEEIRNYTDCTALSSGWSWQVPLWGRMGCGYVYSSSFISDTDAKKELSDHIAGTLGVSDLEDSDFKVIRLRTGYRDRSWEKNCISIGLSSQFLEPLESTGLVFVVNQIRSLISLLDSKNLSYNEFSRATYNYESKKFFEEAKYFVLMHYLNTSRDDSEYWKHIKEQRVPEYLLTLISNITNKGDWEVEYNRMFHQKSWEHIMVGFKGIDFTKNLYIGGEPINLVTQKEDIREILEHLKSLEISNSETVNEMSTHYDYLMENLYGNDSDSR
jgi:tryptophan halogenase